MIYHVINRGNGRARVLHKDGGLAALLELMRMAGHFARVGVLGFCLTPNHFHMVLRPGGAGDLARWMHWLSSTLVRRYRLHYREVGLGHVWQGRFKAFPVQSRGHLLTVLCYVERNPMRAGLVARAEDWPWSSLWGRQNRRLGGLLCDWPVPRPDDWQDRVNRTGPESDLSAIRNCVARGAPYGAQEWLTRTAEQLRLTHALRPRGRSWKELVK